MNKINVDQINTNALNQQSIKSRASSPYSKTQLGYFRQEILTIAQEPTVAIEYFNAQEQVQFDENAEKYQRHNHTFRRFRIESTFLVNLQRGESSPVSVSELEAIDTDFSPTF